MSNYSLYIEEVKHAQSLGEIEHMVWRFSAQAPTSSSGGILYSGRFNETMKTEQASIEFSKQTGANIINNTPRGQLLGNEGVWTAIRDRAIEFFESQGMKNADAEKSAYDFLYGDAKAPPESPLSIKNCLWCKSSREFVSSLRGDVYVVSDGAPPNRVFAQVEFPAALENPKITTIGGMHREHLVALSKHNPKNMLEMVERPFHEAAPHIAQNTQGEIEFSPRAWSEMGVQTPTMRAQGLAMKGAGALGVAATAYDAATTAQNVANQLNQGNSTAAQSAVQHFGGRNLGMLAGAVAGTELGAAAGIESGPGVFVIGAVGGIAGAVAGDKLMDAADQARIYRQRGSDGNTWHRDANHPAQGWTRMVQTSEIDTSVLPNLDTGMPVYKIQTLHADADLADELNYKASNTAVELRLGHPNSPQDPYTQRPDPGEMGKGFIYGDWKRDTAGQWNRSAADMRHGPSEMRELHQVADSQKTAQLDAAARRVEQENAAHAPQAIAQEYQKAYDQYGWKQYGPMPAAVTNHLQATQQPSHTPSAQAPVVPHSQPASIKTDAPPEPARPKPITKDSSIDEMFEALMAAKDDETMRAIGRAYEQSDVGRQRMAYIDELGKQRLAQQDMERLLAFKDPRNPQHPDHALYQQIREQLPGVYAKQGVHLSPTELENGVASVMACARKSRMTEITSMSAGESSNQPGVTRVFMYQNKPGENSGPNKFNYTDIIQAIATPAQESYQQFDKITQQNQAQDLQMEMQRQQQSMSRGGFSR